MLSTRSTHEVMVQATTVAMPYVDNSSKAIRHFLYTRGWKLDKKTGHWRSNYSSTGFSNVNDVLRFDYQLRQGLKPDVAYRAVPKFTFEKTQREINKRKTRNLPQQ